MIITDQSMNQNVPATSS